MGRGKGEGETQFLNLFLCDVSVAADGHVVLYLRRPTLNNRQ